MSCLEIVVLILVGGFVSLIEIAAIMICAGKMFDAKMRTKVELEMKIWDKEMEYIDKMFDRYMTRIEKLFEKEKEPEKKIGFERDDT